MRLNKEVIVKKQLKYMGRLKEEKNCFNKVCLYKILILSALTSSGKTFLFPATRKAFYTWEILSTVFRKKRNFREIRMPFLHLLFFKCHQFKIILMPVRHILGWYIFLPFSVIQCSKLGLHFCSDGYNNLGPAQYLSL